MKIICFSTLFPNAAQPNHGIFVENRFRTMVGAGSLTAEVVAPVPWFFSQSRRFGKYAVFAAVPSEETRHGIRVVHPRFVTVPKVGVSLAPWLLYRGALRAVRSGAARIEASLIDAHYLYPDGVAAVLVGNRLGLPVVLTARGTDVNLLPQHPIARRWILWATARAAGLVAVSDSLAEQMAKLGVPRERIRVLRNGIDLETFQPRERQASRQALGVSGPTVLSVGSLDENKGHHLVVRAVAELPGVELRIVGEGPYRARLEDLVRELSVGDRVRLVGRVPHASLPELYSAADVFALASGREGWPNVLLEAMACGTPVVATRVGGIPEVVRSPDAGVLVDRDVAAIREGLRSMLTAPPSRAATRRYAEGFSWDETTRGQLELFDSIVKG